MVKTCTSIVLEGGEGAGKGSVAQLLKSHFEDAGKKVHLTREPGGTELCEDIRSLILDDKYEGIMQPITEAYLYAASRAQLVGEDILPALSSNDYIVIDRFVYSSIVYQGIVGGLGEEAVAEINRQALCGWQPDLIVYLDIAPDRALNRIFSDGDREVNRFDRKSLNFHERVRTGYLALASHTPNMHVVDADAEPGEILKNILALIEGVE